MIPCTVWSTLWRSVIRGSRVWIQLSLVAELTLALQSSVAAGAGKTPESAAAQNPVGSEHTCVATKSGGIRCWGANFSGQLGDGTNVSRNSPASVSGLTGGVSAIAAGSEHTCAVTEGGVQCWGANASGQLGDGTSASRNTPVNVPGLSEGVSAIAAGNEHTCAVVAGRVKCWGSNASGQLGDGTFANRNMPVSISGLPDAVTAISAGAVHTCALTSAGAVWCWGGNFSGQLGDTTNVNRNTPMYASGLSRGIADVAAGAEHTCALTTNGTVKCWGANFSGQLGDGTNINRSVPVNVSGLAGVASDIAAGSEHTCAVVGAGVKCWGANLSGQLGDGTYTNRTTPADVSGLLAAVIAIAAGSEHTCAFTPDGTIACWGANFAGQLGDGTNVKRNTPLGVTGLPATRPSVHWRVL